MLLLMLKVNYYLVETNEKVGSMSLRIFVSDILLWEFPLNCGAGIVKMLSESKK